MAGFLNYLNEFEIKSEKVVEKIVTKKNEIQKDSPLVVTHPRILEKLQNLTPEDMNILEEAIEEAIEKIISNKNKIVHKEKKVKINEKKIIKSIPEKSVRRAIDILEGLPNNHETLEIQIVENNQQVIQEVRQPNQNFNLNSVKGHAAALL